MKITKYTLLNILLLIVYLVIFYSDSIRTEYYNTFSEISFIIYLLNWIIYFKKFRRRWIFCPELLIFLIGMVITFFDLIVISTIDTPDGIFSRFSVAMRFKALCLSMVAYSSYILGGSLQKKHNKNIKNRQKSYYHLEELPIKIYNIVASILIMYIFVSGLYTKYFKYDGNTNDESLLLYTVIITSLLMVCSVLEFTRMNSIGIHSFKLLFWKIDKLYLFNITIVSALFLLSGNRSDMLLIFFPFIILTYYLIKKVKNVVVYSGMSVGILVMVVIGITRNPSETSAVKEAGAVYAICRDFGAAHINQQGLIWYTDHHGYYGLRMGVGTLISSIPYLGGFILDSSSSGGDGNTNEISTREWQSPSNKESGLGSALFGDLYYAGGIIFVIIYMFSLGFFLSMVYGKLISKSKIGICGLLLYCWFFSDLVYLLRAPYYSLFRFIGFSFVMYFFYKLLSDVIKRVNRIRYEIA